MGQTSKEALDALDNLDAIEVQFNLLLHDYNNAIHAARTAVGVIHKMKEEKDISANHHSE